MSIVRSRCARMGNGFPLYSGVVGWQRLSRQPSRRLVYDEMHDTFVFALIHLHMRARVRIPDAGQSVDSKSMNVRAVPRKYPPWATSPAFVREPNEDQEPSTCTQRAHGLHRRHGLPRPGRERRARAHRQGRGRAPRGALLQAGAWPAGCHAERAHGGVHQGGERVGLRRPGRARVPDACDAWDGQGREGPLLQDAGQPARGGRTRHVAARAALRLLQGLPADEPRACRRRSKTVPSR